jgi:pimeloyl-ACP methyl ester carboxylesterase
MECKVRDLNVFYEEFGKGRPLLMLHGWPTDHRHMVNDMEPLFESRSGWRRIYPDLPGMGKTHAADWITSQDQMLDVILEFIDVVAPSERFVVAGTSYGGYMARGMVYRRKVHIDGLLITVPVVETDATKEHLPPHLVVREDHQFLTALKPDEQDMRDMVVVQSLELLDVIRTVIQPAAAIADHDFLERLHKNYPFSFNVDSLLEPFPAPTLLLTGRQDNWCGYREAYQILDNYPRGTFAVLDRAGHALGIEQKTLFRALVSEWLDRVEEYTLMNANQKL